MVGVENVLNELANYRFIKGFLLSNVHVYARMYYLHGGR